MPRPQISSIKRTASDGTIIVAGRGFRDGMRLHLRVDGIDAEIEPNYVEKTYAMFSSRLPQSASASLVNVNAEESRHFVIDPFISTHLPTLGHIKTADYGERPLRIIVIANPIYLDGSTYRRDPILQYPEAFGKRVGQLLFDVYRRKSLTPFSIPDVRNATEWLSLFDEHAADEWDGNTKPPEHLVLCKRYVHQGRRRIEASRRRVQTFLERYGSWADLAIVLSGARSAQPTGWFASDNPSRGFVEFTFDGQTYQHCFYSALPGVVAFSQRSIRAYEVQHELYHAISSYENGQILDEYDLSTVYQGPSPGFEFAVNKKYQAESIDFAEYNGQYFEGVRQRVKGRFVFFPKPKQRSLCIMKSLANNPSADHLVERFVADRLMVKVNRTI